MLKFSTTDVHKKMHCGETETWREDVCESLLATCKINHQPKVLGPNASFLCIIVLALPMRKNKHEVLIHQETCYLLCILWLHRKKGLILKKRPSRPQCFRILHHRVFSTFLHGKCRMKCVLQHGGGGSSVYQETDKLALL